MRLNKTHCCDCIIGVNLLPDECIDMTLTSPPYDNLRSYEGESSWDFVKFKTLAKELYRVTKRGGVIVWVVGDATVNGSETGTAFKQALYFIQCGFKLHDTMIYAKNNPIPQNHNRYEQLFEYMFVFSKGKPKVFNGLREPTKNKGSSFDWGKRKTLLDDSQCRRHRKHSEIRPVKEDKLRGNIFYYSIGGGKTGHPAVFPEQLAKDQILSWTNAGDVILDPFMGSGTTAKAALTLQRQYIGFEISKKYCSISEERVLGMNRQRIELLELC